MTFDLQEILKSKQAFRRRLAAQPIAEKLRMLDELRDRALAIAATRRVREPPRQPQDAANVAPHNTGG